MGMCYKPHPEEYQSGLCRGSPFTLSSGGPNEYIINLHCKDS